MNLYLENITAKKLLEVNGLTSQIYDVRPDYCNITVYPII